MKSTLKVFAACCAFAALSAQAGVSSYSDLTSFSSASTGLTEFTFDFFNPGGGNTQAFAGNPVTVPGSGVSFTSENSFVWDVGALGSNTTSVYTGQSGDVSTNPNTVRATFTGATAISFYYGVFNPATGPISVTVTAGTNQAFSLPLPVVNIYNNFIGFTSSVAITKVVFAQSISDNAFAVQSFSVGSIAPVPEPSIGILLGVGLALIGTIARRKSR